MRLRPQDRHEHGHEYELKGGHKHERKTRSLTGTRKQLT